MKVFLASLRGLSKGFGSEFLRAVHFGEQALSLDKSISLDEKLSLFFAFDTLRSFPDLRFHTGEPLIFTKDTNVGHINIPTLHTVSSSSQPCESSTVPSTNNGQERIKGNLHIRCCSSSH